MTHDHDHTDHPHEHHDHGSHEHHDHGPHEHHDHGGHEHHQDHGGHEHHHHPDGHGHHHHEPAAGATNLVTCPVMPGNQVDPAWAEHRGLFRDYEGTRYWFCCAECGPLFDADPVRYAHAA